MTCLKRCPCCGSDQIRSMISDECDGAYWVGIQCMNCSFSVRKSLGFDPDDDHELSDGASVTYREIERIWNQEVAE